MDQDIEFNKAKTTFKKALEAGNIDKEIIEPLVLLNLDDRIATRYSCEGHIEEKTGKFYIQFIRNKEFQLLIDIFDKLRDKLIDHNDKNSNGKFYIFALELIISSAMDTDHTYIKTVTIEYYPRKFLGCRVFKSEEQKKIFIELFTESAIEVLSKQ